MYQISNFTDNDDVKILSELGAFQVIEYQRDLSVTPGSAITAYYSAQMNVRKRQLVCHLSKAPVTIQAGAMQWMLGNVNATTGIKGVGDFLGKAVRGKASGESAIKPEYTGDGLLVLEPTYKYLILMNAADWGGSVVLDDGLFLACESSLQHKAVMRSNFSSAVAGGAVQPEPQRQRRLLHRVQLSQRGAGGDHPAQRRAQDRRQLRHRLEREPGVHGGALGKEPHRLGRLR